MPEPWPVESIHAGECILNLCLSDGQPLAQREEAAALGLRELATVKDVDEGWLWTGHGHPDNGVHVVNSLCCRGGLGEFMYSSERHEVLPMIQWNESNPSTWEGVSATWLQQAWAEVYYCVKARYNDPCRNIAKWDGSRGTLTWVGHVESGDIHDLSYPWAAVRDDETSFRLVNLETGRNWSFAGDMNLFEGGGLFFYANGIKEWRYEEEELVRHDVGVDETFVPFGPYIIQNGHNDEGPLFAVHRETHERVDLQQLSGDCLLPSSYGYPWLTGYCDNHPDPGDCIAINIETQQVIKVGSTDFRISDKCYTDGHMMSVWARNDPNVYGLPLE